MQKESKPASAHMGVAFLFLTLASVPVSLRAVGFDVTLNASSVVGAWGQVAGIFVSGYQPVSAMEWAALSLLNRDDLKDVESGPEDQPCLATGCEPEGRDQLEPDSAVAWAAEAVASAKQPRKCPKQSGRPAPAPRRVELAVVRDKLLPRSLLRLETTDPDHVIKLVSFAQDSILKDVEEQISQYKFDMLRARAALRMKPGNIRLLFNPEAVGGPEPELQRARHLRYRVETERKIRCLPTAEVKPVSLDTSEL